MINNKEKKSTIIKLFNRIPFVISLLAIIAFFFDIGFDHELDESKIMKMIYSFSIIIGTISIIVRYFFKENRPRLKALSLDIVLVTFFMLLILQQFNIAFFLPATLFKQPFWLYIAIFIVFIREISAFTIDFKRTIINLHNYLLLAF